MHGRVSCRAFHALHGNTVYPILLALQGIVGRHGTGVRYLYPAPSNTQLE